jgi:hypothetical protein
MRGFRDHLRAALTQLPAVPGRGPAARHASPDDDFADVENVALYNVGAGAYSHLVADGLTCFRTRSPDHRHHLTYRVAALEEPWPAGRHHCSSAPVRGFVQMGVIG